MNGIEKDTSIQNAGNVLTFSLVAHVCYTILMVLAFSNVFSSNIFTLPFSCKGQGP